MPVFIDMEGCSIRQIEAAIEVNENHPELIPAHVAHTHEQIFLLGTPSDMLLRDADHGREYFSNKYSWISKDKFEGDLPDHLKDKA